MTFDPNNPHNLPCPHCGHDRDKDLKLPCPLCDSRQYLFLGYNYSHEVKVFRWALAIVVTIVLLALVAGAGFLIYVNFL